MGARGRSGWADELRPNIGGRGVRGVALVRSASGGRGNNSRKDIDYIHAGGCLCTFCLFTIVYHICFVLDLDCIGAIDVAA